MIIVGHLGVGTYYLIQLFGLDAIRLKNLDLLSLLEN